MAGKCVDCGRSGVPLVGLGGAGIGKTRKRCIACFEAALKKGAGMVRRAAGGRER